MARIEIDPNYSTPTFSRATAPTDIFKKEDVQSVAAAFSTHVHDGVGTGLAIKTLPSTVTHSGTLTISGGPLTISPGPLNIGSASLSDAGSANLGLSGSITIPNAAGYFVTGGPTINANGLTFAGGSFIAGSGGNITVGGPTIFQQTLTVTGAAAVNGLLTAATGITVTNGTLTFGSTGTGVVFVDTNSRIFSNARVTYFDEYNGGWFWRNTVSGTVVEMQLTGAGNLGTTGAISAGTTINAANAVQSPVFYVGPPGDSTKELTHDGSNLIYRAKTGFSHLFQDQGGNPAPISVSAASVGAAPVASVGAVRLANNTLVLWRNGGNSADVGIGVDPSNNLIDNAVTTAASATAGASGTEPAQVAGYLVINLNGAQRKVPYYMP
jgi:hypothetical protein